MATSEKTPLDPREVSPAQWYALERAVQLYGGARFYEGGLKRRLTRAAVSLAFRSIFDMVLLTSSYQVHDPSGSSMLFHSKDGAIISCWHQRLIGSVLYARQAFLRQRVPVRVSALVSESNDGELIARLFRDMGGSVIRGSSSRGGSDSLRAMLKDIKRGGAVVLTPDGPRGPKNVAQEGIFALARMSGAPILPMSLAFGRALCLRRSWDQFLIPLPFGRIEVFFGEPLYVEKNTKGEALEAAKATFMERMNALDEQAIARAAKIYALGKPRPDQ